MRLYTCVATICVLYSAELSRAHPGPRIWVDVLNGKVVTYAGAYPPGDPSDYHLSQVFTQPLVDEGDDIWDNDFPGYQQVPGGHIPVGTKFSYNIMGPVLWYNPGDAAHCPFFETVQQHFAGSPPIPQFAITNELLQTQYTSTGFVNGNTAYQYNGGSGDHNHLTYTLLGDGIDAGGSPDGIYALQLQLTAGGYTPSDTFYLLLGKNASDADLGTAADIILAPRVPPDLDCDGDVDTADLALLRVCSTGAGIPMPSPAAGLEYCVRADFDRDDDVDLDDFGIFQRCYGGTAPVAPGCW